MTDPLAEEVREVVRREVDTLEKLTTDLLRFPTERLTGAYFQECAEYLSDQLQAVGVAAELLKIPDHEVRRLEADGSHYRFLGADAPLAPRWAVIGHLDGTDPGSRSLHLNGHFCVVEPVPGWTANPFEPVVLGDRIIGRGASDMKSGLAAIVVALKALRVVLGSPGGDVHVSMTVDTHFGGDLGAGFVASKGIGRSDQVIVTDTSGPDTVLLGYRGQLWAEIETRGREAHGSTPGYGRNAVADMVEVLAALIRHGEELEVHESEHPIIPMSSRRPTLVVGSTIAGGRRMNLVPDRCVATLDRRLLPEETPDEALKAMSEVVQRVATESPGMEVRIRSLFQAKPSVTPADDPLVQTVMRTIDEYGPARAIVHPAFLDLQWFTQAWGVPGIVYGPGDGGAASEFRFKPYSAPDEFVDRESLVRATTVLATSIARLTALPA